MFRVLTHLPPTALPSHPGIKAIKLYAWEEPYVERITALRRDELRATRLAAFLSTINSMVFVGGPILISLAVSACDALCTCGLELQLTTCDAEYCNTD